MITDRQYQQLLMGRNRGYTLKQNAMKAGVSENTARKHLKTQQAPSQTKVENTQRSLCWALGGAHPTLTTARTGTGSGHRDPVFGGKVSRSGLGKASAYPPTPDGSVETLGRAGTRGVFPAERAPRPDGANRLDAFGGTGNHPWRR